MTQQTEKMIQRKINSIKKKLTALGEFRPGSLSTQFNVCGTAGCKCKDKKNPKKHGPYYQLSFYAGKGKHTTRFIKKHNLKSVESEIRNYKVLKQLVDEWIQLSIELSNIKLSSGEKNMKK